MGHSRIVSGATKSLGRGLTLRNCEIDGWVSEVGGRCGVPAVVRFKRVGGGRLRK